MYSALRKVLAQNGISIYRLGKITGIWSQDLYNALNGKRELHPGWKKRIAEALNIDVESLFNEEGKDISDGTN